ncbi:hypothetical protein DI272_27625 [Streptomyces sp. Act143]|uniref:hypothetical protein n=1 Tax=Streptomyces sp. Act143 TaxID=2200760 RepID=UPI000D679DF9|nr:hypothetical protein [Streptomyces sp. Act143]PWI17511.1 hypothetical protein DI272_27625 [Streptomyces sp. Act143]
MGRLRRVTGALRIWARRNPVQSAGYLFLAAIAAVMLWMAVVLALHAGLFGFSVGSSPEGEELTVFATFIGGGLATAATLFGTLLTAEHNARERQRLDVTSLLEAIPPGTPQRLSGTLSATILIGQPRVAIRILEPAWDAGDVDNGTATWIIDEILADGALKHPYHMEAQFADDTTLVEAASLLLLHAKSLTNPTNRGEYAFPGHFMDGWDVSRGVPVLAKMFVLQATAEVLLSQDRDWWCEGDQMQDFPLHVWRDCALKSGEDEEVRSSAAALFSALRSCFSETEQRRYESRHPDAALIERDFRAYEGKADGECFELAKEIAEKWSNNRVETAAAA